MRCLGIVIWMVCVVCLPTAAAVGAAEAEKPKPAAAEKSAEKQPAPGAAKPVKDKAEPKAAPKPKQATVARMTLGGDYPEGPSAPGLFAEILPSLRRTIGRIDAAAKDDDVDALWLRIEPLSMGRAKIHELRAAIARFRKSGKPVYAELASGDGLQYLLAVACDEIVMPPGGMLLVPGVRAEVTFYKGLLEKLGIEFDMLQMGKYKGAAEPFTRTEMSPPLRESIEAVVDESYESLVAAIAEGRGMKDYQVKTLIDQGLFPAAAARAAGLIDRVVYPDQFEEQLRKQLGADELDLVTDYGKKKIDTDFSGLAGLTKLMQLFTGAKPEKAARAEKKIAVVYAVGPIMLGQSASDLFGGSYVGSATMVKALRQAADDEDVVAIVLRIDSPGGSATASDLIWRETVRIEKPIIASMSDVAASGGYYIAMGADRIVATPGTVTGSIGVVGGKIVLGGLYDKIGLSTEVISRGAVSGAFSSEAPFTPEERAAMQRLLRDIYRQFVGKAAQGRNMSPKELEKLAQGRVWTGRAALKNGLVDELGTLEDAIAAAKKAAGVKPDEEVDLLILPKPKTLFEQLFGSDEDVSVRVTAELERLAPELAEAARRSRHLRRLFSEPTLFWMPFELRLR